MAKSTLIGKSGLLAACLLLAGILIVAGCSRPAAVSSADPATDANVRGPYPAGLTVTLNGVSFYLESIEVADRRSFADSSVVVAPDRRRVDLAFVFRGPGTNPAPGGGFFYPNVELIADSKHIPIDSSLEAGYDMEAPEGAAPRETVSFEAPAGAQSAVIRVIPSFADTQTVAFRLW